MKKLLLYGDSPIATTGLGQLHRVLLKALYETGEWEIDVVGLNHNSTYYEPSVYPYRIHPVGLTNDPRFGIPFTKALINAIDFDLIILSHDFQNVFQLYDEVFKKKISHNTKIVVYAPVDSMEINMYSASLMEQADLLLTYSQYAVDRIVEKVGSKNSKAKALHLPIENSITEPSDEDKLKFRKEFWDWDKNHFVISNINRYITRKDLPKTIYAFKEVIKKYPNARLYLNAIENDIGGNILHLLEMADVPNEFVKISPLQSAVIGLPKETLMRIYYSSDLIISTSKGEGYGYSTVEAFISKVPFLGPRNTSFIELVGSNEERGYLCNSSGWTIDEKMLNRREIVDEKEFANKIIYIIKNYDEAKEKAELAYKFANDNLTEINWSKRFIQLINNLWLTK